jgi:hypothetical protein
VNGNHYFASQTTTGCESVTRLDVTVVVNTTPGAPTGNATQTFCSGNNPTIANLAATGSNIKWYDAASGGNLLTGTTALANGNHYFASQTTAGCESVIRLDVTAVVNTTPGAPTGNATQAFCSANPTVANLTATGSGIKWYDQATGGNLLAGTTALVDGGHYFASQTSNGCESNTRFDVTVALNASLSVTCPDPISVSADAAPGCTASVPFAANVAGTGNVTITYKIGQTVITSPHVFPIGTTTVDVEAVTDCGTTTCSFTVTVNDATAPTISGQLVSIPASTGVGNTTCAAMIDAGAVLPSATDCSNFTTVDHAGAPVNLNFADGRSVEGLCVPCRNNPRSPTRSLMRTITQVVLHLM